MNVKKRKPYSLPSSISSTEVLKIKQYLEKMIQSSLPLSFPSKTLSFSSFEYEVETDQWHFTIKLELPVPPECRSIKIGEERDRKHKTIVDFMKHTRLELFQSIKQEIGHIYFLASIDEYRLKTPLIPQHIALYSNEESRWKLLNQAERICFKHQYPNKKSLIDYSEMAMDKMWFGFDENNKEQPFFPLVYSHIEAEYSFIMANVTYQYYINEKQRQKRKIG